MKRLLPIFLPILLIILLWTSQGWTFHHETDFAPHDLTSDTSHSPFVVSASTNAGAGYEEWRAFEGHNSGGYTSIWASNNANATDYLQLYIGSTPKKLSSYTLYSASGAADWAPKDWTMQGSTNGTDWDVLDTRSGITGWTAGVAKNFVCSTYTTAYNYFRINITAVQSGQYKEVAELYLYYDDLSYVDNYNTVISSNNQSLDNLVTMMSQSFTPQYAYSLVTVSFKLKKVGSPAGNITCYLKTDSGTYGTSSVPTTPVHSTSATVAASSLGTNYSWVYFTFPADYTMPLSPLSLELDYVSGTATDYIVAQYDSGSGAASGNWAIYTGGSWVPIATRDFYYYVGGNAPAGNLSGMMVQLKRFFDKLLPHAAFAGLK